MTKYRVFMHSPAYLVFRRFEIDADDPESAIESAKFEVSEKNREDPDATFWANEIKETK